MFEYSQHKDTIGQKEKNDNTTVTKDRQTERQNSLYKESERQTCGHSYSVTKRQIDQQKCPSLMNPLLYRETERHKLQKTDRQGDRKAELQTGHTFRVSCKKSKQKRNLNKFRSGVLALFIANKTEFQMSY